MILAGAQDWMLPPELLAGADRHADDLQLRVVPGAGHFLPAERPAVVAEAARELFHRTLPPGDNGGDDRPTQRSTPRWSARPSTATGSPWRT